jgi:hypothetical protein
MLRLAVALAAAVAVPAAAQLCSDPVCYYNFTIGTTLSMYLLQGQYLTFPIVRGGRSPTSPFCSRRGGNLSFVSVPAYRLPSQQNGVLWYHAWNMDGSGGQLKQVPPELVRTCARAAALGWGVPVTLLMGQRRMCCVFRGCVCCRFQPCWCLTAMSGTL